MPLFFRDLPPYGTTVTCSACEHEKALQNTVRMRVGRKNEVRRLVEFQCTGCGSTALLEGYAPDEATVAKERCGCGGELRRDRPFFCPACGHGKKADSREGGEPTYDLETTGTLEGLEQKFYCSDRFSTVERMDLLPWSALYREANQKYKYFAQGGDPYSNARNFCYYNWIMNSDEEMEAALRNRQRKLGY